MKPTHIYQDTINHLTAEATTKIMAWQLIRTEIKRLNYINDTQLTIPTYDQIQEVIH